MNYYRSLILTLTILLGNIALAGGSVNFREQVLPVLNQEQELSEPLLSAFEVNPVATAEIRLGRHTNFGGMRVGPYVCEVRSVESKEKGWPFLMIISTEYIVQDKEGKDVDILDQSAKVLKEKFVSVKLIKNPDFKGDEKKAGDAEDKVEEKKIEEKPE